MKHIHLIILLFFVKRGLNIAQACNRMNKLTKEFYDLADSPLKREIMYARWEYKLLRSKSNNYVKLQELCLDDIEQQQFDTLSNWKPVANYNIQHGENYIAYSDMARPADLPILIHRHRNSAN